MKKIGEDITSAKSEQGAEDYQFWMALNDIGLKTFRYKILELSRLLCADPAAIHPLKLEVGDDKILTIAEDIIQQIIETSLHGVPSSDEIDISFVASKLQTQFQLLVEVEFKKRIKALFKAQQE